MAHEANLSYFGRSASFLSQRLNFKEMTNKGILISVEVLSQFKLLLCLLWLSRQVVSDSFAAPWLQPTKLLCPWDFPGKNIRMGCHFLLHEIFPIQWFNLHLLHWQESSLPLNHQGSPLTSYTVSFNPIHG